MVRLIQPKSTSNADGFPHSFSMSQSTTFLPHLLRIRNSGTGIAFDNDSEAFVLAQDVIDNNSGISCTKDKAVEEAVYE